jgi:deazaflavin-dependent oxidoreductase (nitroreductase family)
MRTHRQVDCLETRPYAQRMVTQTKSRAAKTVLLAFMVVGVGQLWLVVLFRVIRRNRAALLRYGPFRRLLKSYNAVTRKMSGTRRSTVGLLTHIGRKSGRSYQTSLGVVAYGDGFLVPLTYGPGTDWFRNLSTAGSGTLAWKGQTYQVGKPEILFGPEPMHSWPARSRIVLQLAGIDEFAWLHQTEG